VLWPEAANPNLPYGNRDRYAINSGTVLRAAIRRRPDAALQLAANILEVLTEAAFVLARSEFGLPPQDIRF
jgi:hypothetical protein